MSAAPRPPREGAILWSCSPPPPVPPGAQGAAVSITDEQVKTFLACTVGWKALELSWGAVQQSDCSSALQLKALLQAALAEASRLGASRLVVQQLDVDDTVGRCCLALALAAFPCFTTLRLRDLNLYDEALGRVCDALHAAEALATLALDGVWASEGGWAALAAAVKVNRSLTKIKLRNCVSGPALPALCGALAGGCSAEEVVLSRNDLGDEGVGELCRAVAQGARAAAPAPGRAAPLSRLDLSHNAAGAAVVPAVALMLRAHRTLRHLDLGHNALGAEGARELCRAVGGTPLQSLCLAATGADDSAAEALARAMAPSLTAAALPLERLDLSHNRLGPRGCAALAGCCLRPAGCGLADVDLGGNAQVGEAGAKAWAEVLAAPASRLRRLVLSGCELPDEAAYALGAALKANSALQQLGLADNHITARGIALLAEVLKVNGGLALLDVSHNLVGPRGMTPFTQLNHLRGHIILNKHTHAVQRVPGRECVVKCELLPEYRRVEADKESDEPWERERIATNPFLAAPDTASGPSNPFLASPSGSGAAPNPFLAGPSASGAAPNPFLSPQPSYVNPFASPQPSLPRDQQGAPAAAPGGEAQAGSNEEGGAGPPAAGSGSQGARTRALRVLRRTASQRSSGSSGGGSAEACGGRAGSSGRCLSSCSTADLADLAGELELRILDAWLERLHIDAGYAAEGGPRGAAPEPGAPPAAAMAAPGAADPLLRLWGQSGGAASQQQHHTAPPPPAPGSAGGALREAAGGAPRPAAGAPLDRRPPPAAAANPFATGCDGDPGSDDGDPQLPAPAPLPGDGGGQGAGWEAGGAAGPERADNPFAAGGDGGWGDGGGQTGGAPQPHGSDNPFL